MGTLENGLKREWLRLTAENARLSTALRAIIKRSDELNSKVDRNSFESGYRQGTDQCSFIAEEALADGQ